ncbi:ferredoxin-NADP reductase [Litorivivens lipolytica]|uniref:Ferredoxin-NADP reductase n=1 Tax=Litorivivens lipolytica TaxID=1524264 RepID=A0A7W4W6L6_9GAMM|nr:iron-sulfur cluster-binding domain-containing protein [Litorivivens lipolytica]MBB3048285.1 ferredoxin-NADP reductase [Litorivivens lipolytica]
MLGVNTEKRWLGAIVSRDQFDFWAQQLGSTAAWERCFARVVSRCEEADDTISLTLKPNANFAGFRAGQHMNLSAIIAGRRVTRSYSFTGLPCADSKQESVSITVRRDPAGVMSDWLYRHAQPGTVLEIGGVFGEMTLEEIQPAATEDLVFLAAGSGITPMISLIKARLAQGVSSLVTLLYWGRRPSAFCFDDELNALLNAHPNFRVHRLTTQEPFVGQPLAGRIHSEQLEQVLGADSSAPRAFICGNAEFVETARQLMNERASTCHVESFSPPARAPQNAVVESITLTLRKSRQVLTVSNQDTLLDALEAQGIAVESGCRMGICNTCTCTVTEGQTRDISTGQLNDGPATRLCVSQPVSNLQLDL